MKIFNLYKTGTEWDASNDNDEVLGEEAVGTSDLTDHNEEENDSIDDQIEKVCKLRIQICHRANNGRLESISEAVDTVFIEESQYI
jgi:hypothetical protein